jgi:hypothetical protein
MENYLARGRAILRESLFNDDCVDRAEGQPGRKGVNNSVPHEKFMSANGQFSRHWAFLLVFILVVFTGTFFYLPDRRGSAPGFGREYRDSAKKAPSTIRTG